MPKFDQVNVARLDTLFFWICWALVASSWLVDQDHLSWSDQLWKAGVNLYFCWSGLRHTLRLKG
jgi:hypothetical protein